ncbi:MAG: hypothetical protein IKJ39_10890 [Lachnospiraceae bacterium]|nr:hypothetical protein [Lachnospiraceae bacterium]
MKRVKRANKKMMITLLCLNLLLGMTACGSKEGVLNDEIDSSNITKGGENNEFVNNEIFIKEEANKKKITVPKVSANNTVLGITMDVIDGMGVAGKYLICTMDGVTYAIGTEKSLHGKAGYLHNESDLTYDFFYDGYSISQGTSGQECIGAYFVEFQTTDTELHSDTKTAVLHNMTYLVDLKDLTGNDEYSLILNISSEDVNKLDEAKVLAKEMIASIRKAENNNSKELQEVSYLPKEYTFPIDVYYTDKSSGYEETVMLISWINTEDRPGEMVVIGPEGQRGILNEEYSIGGHYLYEFGKTNGGEYYIHGGTDVKLKDTIIGVMSMESYLDLYHYYEIYDDVPDYILHRQDEDYDY